MIILFCWCKLLSMVIKHCLSFCHGWLSIELFVLLLILMVKPCCFWQVVKLWGIISTWWLSFDSFMDWWFESFDVCFGLLEEDWESRYWSNISKSYAPWSHLHFDLFLNLCFDRCIFGMFSYILIFHFIFIFFYANVLSSSN